MRRLVFGIVAAICLSTIANAGSFTAPSYNCISHQSVGPAHPQSHRTDAKYLYMTTVMVHKQNGGYGAVTGWAIEGNFKAACGYALEGAAKSNPTAQGWTITVAVLELIPDDILKQGLSH